MNRIELLAPAGDLEKAKTAILYGADAVYVGGKSFSLRSRASNFDLEQIAELAVFAHEHGSKVHVTVNMLPHEEDLAGLDDYLVALDNAGVDAIIAASPYILLRAKELGCTFERHVSTQHSTLNHEAAAFWKAQGMDRVVLGRECTLEQIQTIAGKCDVDLEVFIHGGMCISFSGRCVLSNHLTNRDANRGGCAQSCRWKYHLSDECGRKLSRDDRMYSMSSKDLKGLRQIPALIEAGITSLKIEGRMKSAYYLATVVSTYRRLIDAVYAGKEISEAFLEALEKQLAKSENRPAGPGFLEGVPDFKMQLYRDEAQRLKQEFTGLVLGSPDENGFVPIQVRNRMDFTGSAEIFGPDIIPADITFEEVRDKGGNTITECSRVMEIVQARFAGPSQPGAMIRRKLREEDISGILKNNESDGVK